MLSWEAESAHGGSLQLLSLCVGGLLTLIGLSHHGVYTFFDSNTSTRANEAFQPYQ
jgi:hypothetical protein